MLSDRQSQCKSLPYVRYIRYGALRIVARGHVHVKPSVGPCGGEVIYLCSDYSKRKKWRIILATTTAITRKEEARVVVFRFAFQAHPNLWDRLLRVLLFRNNSSSSSNRPFPLEAAALLLWQTTIKPCFVSKRRPK